MREPFIPLLPFQQGHLGSLPFRPIDVIMLTFLGPLMSLYSAIPLQMPMKTILHMLHFLKLPKLNVPSGPFLTQVLCKISLEKLAITKNMFQTKRLG